MKEINSREIGAITKKRKELTSKPNPNSILATTLEVKRRLNIARYTALTVALLAVVGIVATNPTASAWMRDIFRPNPGIVVQTNETQIPKTVPTRTAEPISTRESQETQAAIENEGDALNELTEYGPLCSNPNKKPIRVEITHPEGNSIVVRSEAEYLPVQERIVGVGVSYALKKCLAGTPTDDGDYEFIFNLDKYGVMDGLDVLDSETEQERFARTQLINTPQINFIFRDKTQSSDGIAYDFVDGKAVLPNEPFSAMVAGFKPELDPTGEW